MHAMLSNNERPNYWFRILEKKMNPNMYIIK